MLIYIVEDDPLKLSRLQSFLDEEFNSIRKEAYFSYQSGLKAIERAPPDLVILDMTLPTFDRAPGAREGRIRPVGGYDLMRKLKLRSLAPKIAVVTQLESFGELGDQISFEQITSKCHIDFPDIFLGSVYFRQSDVAWKAELAELINKVFLEDGAP